MRKAEFAWKDEDRYEIIAFLGSGGCSKSYLVLDKKLSIKRVMKKPAGEGEENYDLIRQQFISEIQIMKGLRHPAIPSVTDVFETVEGLVLVMDYVEGITLEELLTKENIREDEFLQLAWQLCDVIAYLHGRKKPVVHKDVKPSNIIIDEERKVHLIDFGIAQELESDIWAFNTLPQGTDYYAAPEQRMADGRIDFRTDVYGFGKTLEFCLKSGAVAKGKVISSKRFQEFLQRCLKEDPQYRFQNTEEIKKVMISLCRKNYDSRLYLYMGFPLIIIFFLSSALFLRDAFHKKEALYYLNCAKECPDSSKALTYYEKSLLEYPGLAKTYESMIDACLSYDNYRAESVYGMINILEESRALEKLEKTSPGVYSEFCYSMGVGFFFYMGGSRGRKESILWFDRALQNKKDGLDARKKSRADCYREIGRYYKTFLTHGQDASGETPLPSYRDFFAVLHKLGKNMEKEENRTTDNLIAFEIAMEIHEFTELFLEDGVIPSKLKSELDQAEKIHDKNHEAVKIKDKENTFAEILEDARKRIHIWEVDHETREELPDNISADDIFLFYNYPGFTGHRR